MMNLILWRQIFSQEKEALSNQALFAYIIVISW